MNNINIVNVMFIPPKLPCGLKKKKKTKITNLTQLGLKSLESQLIIRRVRFLSIWEREREREPGQQYWWLKDKEEENSKMRS